MNPIFYDSHMHTPLCKHATGDPGEYAKRAREVGLKGIIVTCHSPMPDGFSRHVRMEMGQFDEYVDLVAEASDQWKGEVDVRLGMESDWFPGMEPWLEELHGKADFHYILGSVHCQLPEYQRAFGHLEALEFQKQYYSHLADAAETGLFDGISHPDLVKNLYSQTWDFDLIESDVARALDRIAAAGVAMELNTSGQHKRFPEMNPGSRQLEMMAERDIPVVLGSDSHRPGRVGEDFILALKNLETAGCHKVAIFLNREQYSFTASEVLEGLEAASP